MPGDIFNVPEEKLPKLNDRELEHYKKILQIPDPRPCDVDGTLEAWLYRISLWGKITLTHINPESKVKHNFTPENFLSYIDDQSRNVAYGLWSVEEVRINKIRFYRAFMSIYGKDVTEEIFVDIDIKPSLLAPLKRERKI